MLQRFLRRNYSQVVYKQGQENHKDPKIREYFYFVDHNGMVSSHALLLFRIIVGNHQGACSDFSHFSHLKLFLDDSRMKNFTSAFKGLFI